MMHDSIIVRYGETFLKSERTRKRYLNLLKRSIKARTGINAKDMRGFLLLEWFEGFEELAKIPGIESFSPAKQTGNSFREVVEAAVEYAKEVAKAKRFRFSASRRDKSLPYTSRDVEREAGRKMEEMGYKADLEKPEIRIHISIGKPTLIYHEKIRGMGGFPLGSSGSAIALVSGGIDSPVAAYLMIKKGVIVHPFLVKLSNSRKEEERFLDVCKVLEEYHPGFRMRRFILEPPKMRFGDLTILFYRRLMIEMASMLAEDIGADFIITGESLGQVSSQTPANIKYLNRFSSVPILRPLIEWDKKDIINLAKEIGTYEISTRRVPEACEGIARSLRARTKPSPEIDKIFEELDLEKFKKMIKEV